MSKTFEVTVPFAGEVVVTVEADSHEAAKEAGFEKACENELIGDVRDDVDHVEFSYLDRLNSGNVCHVSTTWEIQVSEVDEG